MSSASSSANRSQGELELARWSAAVQAMQVENAALKTRLAEAIRHCNDGALLEQWEDFQARLLASDTVLLLLRRDVAALALHSDATSPETAYALHRIAADLKRMHREASGLRLEFERSLERAGATGGAV